jgi:hypothetical protein
MHVKVYYFDFVMQPNNHSFIRIFSQIGYKSGMNFFIEIIFVYFGYMLEPIVEIWQFYFYFFQNLMNHGFFLLPQKKH